METVIEKAVELGVYEIIPVAMKYCVVKLEGKKAAQRVQKWQAQAETAAKQSKRSIIPKIHEVVSFKEALKLAENCDIRLVPYENENRTGEEYQHYDRTGRRICRGRDCKSKRDHAVHFLRKKNTSDRYSRYLHDVHVDAAIREPYITKKQ